MTHFAIVDPRTFDGNPYEVAERAAEQARALAEILEQALRDAYPMIRNAALERQIVLGGEPDAVAFEQSLEGQRWQEMPEDAHKLVRSLTAFGRAAGWNPKAPIG